MFAVLISSIVNYNNLLEMFAEESVWISSAYKKMDSNTVRIAGNIGSSSLDFRLNVQPHIHANIIKPLLEKGVQVVNIDLKKG